MLIIFLKKNWEVVSGDCEVSFTTYSRRVKYMRSWVLLKKTKLKVCLHARCKWTIKTVCGFGGKNSIRDKSLYFS